MKIEGVSSRTFVVVWFFVENVVFPRPLKSILVLHSSTMWANGACCCLLFIKIKTFYARRFVLDLEVGTRLTEVIKLADFYFFILAGTPCLSVSDHKKNGFRITWAHGQQTFFEFPWPRDSVHAPFSNFTTARQNSLKNSDFRTCGE